MEIKRRKVIEQSDDFQSTSFISSSYLSERMASDPISRKKLAKRERKMSTDQLEKAFKKGYSPVSRIGQEKLLKGTFDHSHAMADFHELEQGDSK